MICIKHDENAVERLEGRLGDPNADHTMYAGLLREIRSLRQRTAFAYRALGLANWLPNAVRGRYFVKAGELYEASARRDYAPAPEAGKLAVKEREPRAGALLKADKCFASALERYAEAGEFGAGARVAEERLMLVGRLPDIAPQNNLPRLGESFQRRERALVAASFYARDGSRYKSGE